MRGYIIHDLSMMHSTRSVEDIKGLIFITVKAQLIKYE